jgi:hypothetical protein
MEILKTIITKEIQVPANQLHNKKKYIEKYINNNFCNKCFELGYIENIFKINKIHKNGRINYQNFDGSVFFNVDFSIEYYPLLEDNFEFELIISSFNNDLIFGNYNNIYDCIVIDLDPKEIYYPGDKIKVKVKKSFIQLEETMIKVICELI